MHKACVNYSSIKIKIKMRKITLFIIAALMNLGVMFSQENVKVRVAATAVVPSDNGTLILSRTYNKLFLVNANLQRGKEYVFILEIDPAQRKLIHCTGCTGVLPAKVVSFSISERQAKKDISKMPMI